MKKVGIVGGIGPASTVDYYKDIIDGYRAATSADNYPHILIDSINITEMLSYVAGKNWNTLTDLLLRSIQNLADGGAEFAVIASNTPHIVFDRIQSKSALPLISIVEETCKHAQAIKCKKVAVFGTYFVMNSGLYAGAFEKYGIAAVVPEEDEQKAIHNVIFPNLQEGIVLPEEKDKVLGIARRMIKEHNTDALMLGCTELPLLLQENDIDTLLLNTTKIHIASVLRYMLRQ